MTQFAHIVCILFYYVTLNIAFNFIENFIFVALIGHFQLLMI